MFCLVVHFSSGGLFVGAQFQWGVFQQRQQFQHAHVALSARRPTKRHGYLAQSPGCLIFTYFYRVFFSFTYLYLVFPYFTQFYLFYVVFLIFTYFYLVFFAILPTP